MKAMSDAGAPMDAILIAVRALEERDAVVAETRAKEAERTRRYRQRGGGQVSPSMRAQILERDGHACLECGDTECLEIDHIIPLNKGGDPTHPDNLQTLCRPCNARKRDRVRKSDNRGQMRKNAESVNVTVKPSLSLPPNENNSNPPTHTHPETPPREGARARKPPAGDEFPKPEWADGLIWQDFLKNRRAKRLPNTATAYRGLLADLARLETDEWPPGRLLEHAVMKGWGAIYAPDELKGTANGKDVRTSGGHGPKPALVDIGRQVAAELEARAAAGLGRH